MEEKEIIKFLEWYHDPERGMSLETDFDDIAQMYLKHIKNKQLARNLGCDKPLGPQHLDPNERFFNPK